MSCVLLKWSNNTRNSTSTLNAIAILWTIELSWEMLPTPLSLAGALNKAGSLGMVHQFKGKRTTKENTQRGLLERINKVLWNILFLINQGAGWPKNLVFSVSWKKQNKTGKPWRISLFQSLYFFITGKWYNL